MQKKAAVRFVSIVARHSSSVSCSMRVDEAMAALLTKTSKPFDDAGDQCAHSFRASDVAGRGPGVAAQFTRESFGALRRADVDCDLSAALDKARGRRATQAARGSGN